MELRRHVRYKHQVNVTWNFSGTAFRGATLDIGLHGAHIMTSQRLSVNSIVDLELKPWDEMPSIHCRCQVVWENLGQVEGFPPGFGVEFVDGREDLSKAGLTHQAMVHHDKCQGEKY
jgi:hypothetical protein